MIVDKSEEVESEFINRMVKAFDYLDVIKKVIECDDVIILKGLKKILDNKIKEMEKIYVH